MVMIPLEFQSVKLAHINSRTESHGEDDVLTLDLKFEAHEPNAVLNTLSPGLLESLYTKHEDGMQDDLPVTADGSPYLPNLKHPKLGPHTWGEEWEDAELIVHSTGSPKKGQKFACKADKLRVTCEEGGTVKLIFRCIVQPDEGDAALLLMLLKKTVPISLRQAEPDDVTLTEGGQDEAA